MTGDYNGPFATVDSDDNFKGEFDEWENEIYVEAYHPQREHRRACKLRVEHGELLSDGEGHVLIGVLDENSAGTSDFTPFPDANIGSRVVITTDGFDRATRTIDPITLEGESEAIGRRTHVFTTRAWAEHIDGRAEIAHEADLDDRRERHFDEHGHF